MGSTIRLIPIRSDSHRSSEGSGTGLDLESREWDERKREARRPRFLDVPSTTIADPARTSLSSTRFRRLAKERFSTVENVDERDAWKGKRGIFVGEDLFSSLRSSLLSLSGSTRCSSLKRVEKQQGCSRREETVNQENPFLFFHRSEKLLPSGASFPRIDTSFHVDRNLSKHRMWGTEGGPFGSGGSRGE